jgi:hypothetical protein
VFLIDFDWVGGERGVVPPKSLRSEVGGKGARARDEASNIPK